MESRPGRQIPWGLRDGEFVHISRIQLEHRGLACGCVCPQCGRQLVARLGEKRARHYAHASDADGVACDVSVETLLHLRAKEIVAQSRYIAVPQLSFGRLFENEAEAKIHVLAPAEAIAVAAARKEVTVASLRPDVLIETDDQEAVAVEILVTHAVDDAKRKALGEEGLPTIEIDLSDFRDRVWDDENELRKALLEETSLKKWVYHPSLAALDAAIEIASDSLELGDGGYPAPERCEAAIDGVVTDCLKCRYCGVAEKIDGVVPAIRCFVRSGATELAEVRSYAASGAEFPIDAAKFPTRRRRMTGAASKPAAKLETVPLAAMKSEKPRGTASFADPRDRVERIRELRKHLPEWADRIDYSNTQSSECFEWIPWEDRNFCMRCQRLAAAVPDPKGGTLYYCVNERCQLGGSCVYRK